MPRTGQQPPQAPNSQAYGVRNDQIQAQQAIPLPREASPAMTPAPSPSAGAPAPAPAGPPVDPMAAAIQAARDFQPNITPLTAASQRPGEPVQTGLSLGPGQGPDVFSQPTRAMKSADLLDSLSQSSGDSSFSDMAMRIRGTGGMR